MRVHKWVYLCMRWLSSGTLRRWEGNNFIPKLLTSTNKSDVFVFIRNLLLLLSYFMCVAHSLYWWLSPTFFPWVDDVSTHMLEHTMNTYIWNGEDDDGVCYIRTANILNLWANICGLFDLYTCFMLSVHHNCMLCVSAKIFFLMEIRNNFQMMFTQTHISYYHHVTW